MVPGAVRAKHAFVQPYVAAVSEHVKDVVRFHCDEHGFAFLSRLKGAESVAEKIETGRFSRWSELDDLFACSVIVPTLSDEPGVLDMLRAAFREVAVKRRGSTKKNPEVFRFDATRFIGTLQRPDGESESHVSTQRFEVQVRTAFEHAWVSATHDAVYKGASVDWRSARLAAQLKAAVEQLDQLVSGYQRGVEMIAAELWPELAAKEMIEREMKDHVRAGLVPTVAVPGSWLRFSENLYSLLVAASERRVMDPVEFSRSALDVIGRELSAQEPAGFPVSISLLQFCVGALAKHGRIGGKLAKYTPLLTEELRSLFPEVRVLGSGFNLEDAPPISERASESGVDAQ